MKDDRKVNSNVVGDMKMSDFGKLNERAMKMKD